MNALINEMAKILEINAAEMMHRMMDLQEEYEVVTPEIVKNSLVHTAHAMGGEYSKKVNELNNQYNKKAAA